MTLVLAATTVRGTMRLFSSQAWVMPSLVPSSPFTLRSKVMSATSELDLDVDAGRQVETHERVDRLRRGVDDVDEPLVGAHFEVLAAVLVLVRRADDAEHVLFRRQRHRASNLRTSTRHRVDNLARRAVDDLVVVGLQPDADLLSRHRFASSFSIVFVALLRPPRSGVSRTRNARDSPLHRPGMVIGARSRTGTSAWSPVRRTSQTRWSGAHPGGLA